MNVRIKDEIFDDFHNADLSGLRMPTVVVYFNTKDYPGEYVARIWDSCAQHEVKTMPAPSNFVMVKDTIDQIRKGIPRNMSKIPRSVDDEVHIVEVYI